ncbi:MAG: stage III sporulation protein AG [Clostridiales bacterium]|nr:stage III sporulation protein AG [Clostridiales bacterium]MCD8109790.1 stage III sporulation protein AG [Clostridiales bacterium]MCD8132349.1 stage III sporulation protein AG [Clostridiales bacterium]
MNEFVNFIRQKKWKNWKKDQWLILFLAGVLLLVIALPSSCEDGSPDEDEEETEVGDKGAADGSSSDYETELEERLEEALSRMEGVGKVQVMITFRDSGETIVEKDVTYTEEDQETEATDGSSTSSSRRDSSEETVYSSDSDDGEPVVSKEMTPTIEGVLVIAEGGDDTTVAMNISEAVEALFGLEVHKIKVVKMVDGQEGSD